MNLAAFLAEATERLKQSGIDNPYLDVRWLACHALGIDRAELLSQSQRALSGDERATINDLLIRRTQRESVARIIGFREFWGLDFYLNEATLEPRPDSETVIEAVLGALSNDDQKTYRLLDLGTGTGCLLLSLLHELPNATGLGIDMNPRAVTQATWNAQNLKLDDRAFFRTGDWLRDIDQRFDIIVSNPPYIPSLDLPDLMPEVRVYDPMLALDGGNDGLSPYRHIIPQLPDFLKPNGIVAFEVGQGQANDVADLLRQAGLSNIALHKDLAGIDRCVTAGFV